VTVDYTTLSLVAVRTGLDEVVCDTQATFGGLDSRQLSWRPDATRWSVAQCFEHLLAANSVMFRAADEALNGSRPRSIWQRLPVWPRLFGRMLIRSQSPDSSRKFTAPQISTPTASDIAADVVQRFIDQQRDAVSRLQTLDEEEATHAIMTSPFVRVITYSVLDGWRLVLAHDRRHIEQARRVTQSRGFPAR
jgi:hypothetical protein